MKKINAIVFCQNNEHGKMEFYIRINNEYNLYLFTTNYYSKKNLCSLPYWQKSGRCIQQDRCFSSAETQRENSPHGKVYVGGKRNPPHNFKEKTEKYAQDQNS